MLCWYGKVNCSVPPSLHCIVDLTHPTRLLQPSTSCTRTGTGPELGTWCTDINYEYLSCELWLFRSNYHNLFHRPMESRDGPVRNGKKLYIGPQTVQHHDAAVWIGIEKPLQIHFERYLKLVYKRSVCTTVNLTIASLKSGCEIGRAGITNGPKSCFGLENSQDIFQVWDVVVNPKTFSWKLTAFRITYDSQFRSYDSAWAFWYKCQNQVMKCARSIAMYCMQCDE